LRRASRFDTVKVCLQTSEAYRGKSMGAVFSHIIKTDGLRGLYRGVESPIAGALAMNMCLFAAYGNARRFLGESPTHELTVSELFAAGFVAGTAVAFVEGPVDFFK
jgi:solute carrier family 25 carnitine/acylcarnitine transporter 20/29